MTFLSHLASLLTPTVCTLCGAVRSARGASPLICNRCGHAHAAAPSRRADR